VAELRRGIEGGVDRCTIRHGAEVGGGSVRRGGACEKATALGRLGEKEGRPHPPPLSGPVGPHGPRKLTGPKASEEFFQI
jgi:hypothetical protein